MKTNLVLLCLVLCGCSARTSVQSVTSVSEVAHQPVAPAAQALLDDLSLKCSSPAWSSEFDLIERPEARPTNYIVSGEVSAYLADSKKRLAALDVNVKWNHEKMRYEVEGDK